jgi:L-threonylcarbamoyladenylate synthase
VTILTERIPLASLLSGKDSKSLLQSLVDRIRNHEVFIYPTETIYGIGGIADSKDVESRIVRIKSRQKDSPFILLGSDLSQFESFGLFFPKTAKLLADKFWPGNLTIVLVSRLHPHGFGVRISDHLFVTSILSALGVPIFSTSANKSDLPYLNDPDSIFKTFDGAVDFMIDAGTLPESKPSTVVKIGLDDTINILREGVISKERIKQALRSGCIGSG